MDELANLWVQIQPIIASAPVAVAVVILLIVGIVKKLVKLAVLAGVLFVVWLVIQQTGIALPI